MSILSEFLIVNDSELASLIGQKFEFDFARSDFSWNGIDNYAIAEIEAALFQTTVEKIESKRGDVFKDWIWFESESDGPWVTEVRPTVVKALASLDEVGVRNVARQWGYEFNVPDEEALEFATGLAEVSRKTLAREARLILWVSL